MMASPKELWLMFKSQRPSLKGLSNINEKNKKRLQWYNKTKNIHIHLCTHRCSCAFLWHHHSWAFYFLNVDVQLMARVRWSHRLAAVVTHRLQEQEVNSVRGTVSALCKRVSMFFFVLLFSSRNKRTSLICLTHLYDLVLFIYF